MRKEKGEQSISRYPHQPWQHREFTRPPHITFIMFDAFISALSSAKVFLWLCVLVFVLVRDLRCSALSIRQLHKIRADGLIHISRFSQAHSTTCTCILYGMCQDPFGREQALYHHGITQSEASATFGYGSYSRSTARRSVSHQIWSYSVTQKPMQPSTV